MANWGGKREGAGRPVGTTKSETNQRKQRQVRAFDDEWPIIKEFVALLREDKEKAEAMLEIMKK